MNHQPPSPSSKNPDTGAVVSLNSAGLPEGYPFRGEWEVTPRQVKASLGRGEEVLLVDCRTPQEYQLAKIEGAKLMPLQQLERWQRELRQSTGKKIVVHCHHGGRSLQMAVRLRQMGLTDVWSMAGGIDLWAMDIDRSLPRY